MTHLPPIISDLAFMLVVAGVVTVIFKWLKQPVVLGYIIAGLLTGPYLSFFPTVSDPESVNIWGEIGVIFLLFGMGLEFSFKKLIRNGKIGFITLLMIIVGLGATGYLLGMWMGWGQWNSLILGCMLCLSSTTIIVKGFEDPRYKGKRFTEVVFGVLIFDDLFAILVMVFLGTIALTRHLEGAEIMMSVGKLIFFMVVWVVGGIYLIPTLLKRIKRWLNDETLLIISLGLCLGMVVFATKVELSSALGAFIMGSILAETIALEDIERVTKPIKDFFGAIFFVSVGMMMDPAIVMEHFTSIMLITILVLAGKIIFTSWGVRLSGESLLTSMQSGFSMAQVGEFAFIVAGTAIVYGVADNFIYPIIIAVSVITTFTTPYLMAAGDGAYSLLMRKLPEHRRQKILAKDERFANPVPKSLWTEFIQDYIFNIVIFVSLGVAVIILAVKFIGPFAAHYMHEPWANIICLAVALAAIAPILKGLVYKGGKQPYMIMKLWKMNFKRRFALSVLIVARYVVAFGFVYFIFWTLLDIPVWITAIAAVALLIILWRSKSLLKLYWKIEYRFAINFNERLINEKRMNSQLQKGVTTFAINNESWIEQNLYVGLFQLEAGSNYENVMLKDTDFRSKYGLLIVKVYRDNRDTFFPSGDFVLFAGDIIVVVGSIIRIRKLATEKNNITLDKSSLTSFHDFAQIHDQSAHSRLKCMSLIVDREMEICGKSLLESEIGKRGRMFVVGLERDNGYEINPSASTVFKEDDIVWVVGNKDRIYEVIEDDFRF